MVTTDDIERIKANIATAEPKEILHVIHTFEDFLRREGYRECTIPACNCGSWHGGNASRRLSEIHELLRDFDVQTNGKTLFDVVHDLAVEAGYAEGE